MAAQLATFSEPQAMTDIVERLRHEGVEFREQLEAADEIERLRKIEQAAQEAYDYHMRGYGPDSAFLFDANSMLSLMDRLGEALEPKP